MKNFEITKREILFSVIIAGIMLIIGYIIHENINEKIMLEHQKYNTAVQITTKDLFEHGMNTNVGNAFVYGELNAIDTVTYPEIGGEYMYVEKVEEHYNRHTRTVSKTINGKTVTSTEVYYSWDYAGSEEITCKEISFLGITFKTNKINIPYADYIDTIKTSNRVRFKYYGTKTKHTGTMFTELKNNTINNSTFYENNTIDETLKFLKSEWELWVFRILWMFLTIGCIVIFYNFDNYWLE